MIPPGVFEITDPLPLNIKLPIVKCVFTFSDKEDMEVV